MAKVLIVDDEPDYRILLSRILSQLDHTTYAVNNGFQCEDLAFSWKPDLILLDYYMPGQNGAITARNLRREGFTATIIVMSASLSTIDTTNALAYGIDALLPKPVSLEALRSVLIRLSKQLIAQHSRE